MGGGIPRKCKRCGYCEMAAGQRRSGAGEHNLHPGLTRMRVPHHGLQLSGGQDPRCPARSTRNKDWTSKRMFRILERSDD